MPAQAPRTGNAFTRRLGGVILRLGGWRIVGEFAQVRAALQSQLPGSGAG